MDEQEKAIYLGWAELPKFKAKVEKSLGYIKEALILNQHASVSVSWGKDSVVLLHLCQQIDPSIMAFNLTDTYRDMQSNYADVIAAFPSLPNYKELIVTEETWSENLRPTPLVFIGCRAEESKYRAISIKKYGVNYQYKNGNYRSFPLAYWQTNDIWAYLVSRNLPFLRNYEGNRSGRTAIIHNFNCHKGDMKHGTGLIRHGMIQRLKKQSPAYFSLYQSLYPEISNYV